MTEQRVPDGSCFRIPHASVPSLLTRRRVGRPDSRTPPGNSDCVQQFGPAKSERFLAGPHVEHGAHFIAPASHLATATRLPSGLRPCRSPAATRSSRPPGQWTDPGSGPDPTSSPQAAATSDPSALNDGAPCVARARQAREEPPRRGVPDLQRAVFPSRGEPGAVRAERARRSHPHRVHGTRGRSPRLRVPDLDQARVLAPLGHEDPFGAPGEEAPTPGTSKSSRDATTARWRASPLPGEPSRPPSGWPRRPRWRARR